MGSRPILYDQSLYIYRDTNRKDRVWKDVSLEMGEIGKKYYLLLLLLLLLFSMYVLIFKLISVLNDC